MHATEFDANLCIGEFTLYIPMLPVRWNDVSQHWSSLIKLLEETLLHLEATHAELRHVTRIRREEIDWLAECQEKAEARVATMGEIPVIEEEIQTHQVHAHIFMIIIRDNSTYANTS